MAKAKDRLYYSLLERVCGVWCPQFGDYDRETVKAEFRDMREHGIKALDLKIIATADDNDAIMKEVARLNASVLDMMKDWVQS